MFDKIFDFRYQFMVLSIVGVVLHSVMSGLAVFFLYISVNAGYMDMTTKSAAILLINLLLVIFYVVMRGKIKRMIERDGTA